MIYGIMITISVDDCNNFSQDYYNSVINSLQMHQVRCSCGASGCLTIHGYYKRGIFLPERVTFLRICRVKCSECGRTHALLLSSIVPYDRISLDDQHRIVCAYTDGEDLKDICKENPFIDEHSAKAVIRRYCRFWKQRLLSERIALKPVRDLLMGCLAHYSMQFMQIRGPRNVPCPFTT